jgi:ATP-binding cassette, subfamily B, bacterial
VKVFKFLIGYAKQYTVPLVASMAAMILTVGVQLVAPWLIRSMINLVTSELESDTLARIDRLVVLALIVYLARGVLFFVRSYMSHMAGWGVVADARSFVYRHLQKLSLRFYDNRQTGQLMSRVVNDSDKLETLIAHAVPDVVVNLLMFIGVGAILMSLNMTLMLLCLIPVPLIVIAMRGFGKYVRPAFRIRQQELGELNATLSDNLSGIREIKAFGQEEREAERIGDHIQRYKVSLLKALRLMATFHPFVDFSASVGFIFLIYLGSRLVLREVLPIADLVAFFLYLEMFYQPVRALSTSWEHVQEAFAGAERLAEILDEVPEVTERHGTKRFDPRSGSGPVGHITFEAVDFFYLENIPVLEGIDLDIPAGTSVALVGPTGVGKTTLASLIPRFYDVTAGRITIDGVDIRDFDLHSLRSHISLVLQDVFLFYRNGTRQHPLLATDRLRRRDDRRGARCERARVHPGAPGGVRHDGRRARSEALGRPEAAARDRAGGARRRTDPHPRRGDFVGRHPDRIAHPRSARASHGRADDDHYCASTLDGAEGRPDRRPREREDP